MIKLGKSRYRYGRSPSRARVLTMEEASSPTSRGASPSTSPGRSTSASWRERRAMFEEKHNVAPLHAKHPSRDLTADEKAAVAATRWAACCGGVAPAPAPLLCLL
jgi:hypothetical protein